MVKLADGRGRAQAMRVRGDLRAPDHRAHARQQLLDAEGLGEVVVGAQIEAVDLVLILPTRRQDDDGHGGELAHPLRDGKAIHPWHHDVEQHEIGGVRLDLFERRLPIAHRDHLIALELEVARDQPQDLGIVVGGQNRRLLRRHRSFSQSSVAG